MPTISVVALWDSVRTEQGGFTAGTVAVSIPGPPGNDGAAGPNTVSPTTLASFANGLILSSNGTNVIGLTPAQLSAILAPYLIPWTPSTPGGLVAQYRFDEGAGSTLVDRSGNSNNGTVTSGATWSSAGLYAGSSTGGVDTSIPWAGVGTVIALVSPNTAIGAVAPGSLFDSQSAGTSGTQFAFIGDLANGQLWPRMLDTVGSGSVAANHSVPTWPVSVGFAGVGNSAPKIYLNGVESSLYSTQTACTRRGNVRIGANYFGQAGGVTFHYVMIYSGTLSPSDMAAATTYMQAQVAARSIAPSGPTTLTTPLVTFSGNSIINLQDLSNVPTILGRAVSVVKVAISGADPATVLALFQQGVLPLYRPLAAFNVALGMLTPNSTDTASILSTSLAFGDTAKAAGFKAVLNYPISAYNGWDALKAVTSADYDANWAAHFDARADFRPYPDVYADGAYLSSTWFRDQLHPTDLAYSTYIIPTECAAIASLLSPVAKFTPSATLIAPGGSIAFTDASIGTVTSRSWNFGDGGTSTQTSPSHTFAAADTYTVSLTVTGPKGTHTTSQTITASTAASILALNPITWLTPGLAALNTAGSAAASGDRLSQLTDRTSNGRHVTQGTAGNQPLLTTVSSILVARFDPTRLDVMNFATNVFNSFTGGAELFVVVKSADTNPRGFCRFGSSGSEDYYTFGGGVYSSFGSTARQSGSYGAATVTNFNVLQVRSVPGEFTIRLNGTSLFTTATNTVGWDSTPWIGKGRAGTGASWDLADLLITPPLSDTDRATVLSYLRTTYGTP